MRKNTHKSTILQAAQNGKNITSSDFNISNVNQYLVKLEKDGFLKTIHIDKKTKKKTRTLVLTKSYQGVLFYY